MSKAGWTALALLLTPLLSPLIGNAEAQTRSEMSQLKHELQALREEVETKNDMIKRMQQRLEALETKMQVEIQRPAEEKLTAMKEEMNTELAASAESSKLLGGQVFFKGGYVRMNQPRRNSLLTVQDDPNDRNGFQVGAGLDLPLMKLFIGFPGYHEPGIASFRRHPDVPRRRRDGRPRTLWGEDGRGSRYPWKHVDYHCPVLQR